MSGQMLERCSDSSSPKTSHHSGAKNAAEIWIFAERLARSSPTRISRDIHYRRQHHVSAAGAYLLGHKCKDLFYQLAVPCRRESEPVREDVHIRRQQPMVRLIKKQDRNSKSRLR